MKKIPCDLFEEGQFIYFNIAKFSQLETLLNKPVMELMLSGSFSLNDIIKMYMVGLSGKKKNEAYYMELMQDRIEEGYTITDFTMPLIKAIIGSGLMGKEAYYQAFPEEKTEDDDIDMEAAKAKK